MQICYSTAAIWMSHTAVVKYVPDGYYIFAKFYLFSHNAPKNDVEPNTIYGFLEKFCNKTYLRSLPDLK